MTFAEVDAMIRASVPDPIARKKILSGIHEWQEAVNQCASWYLGVSGYTVKDDQIYKEGSKTRFQVND